MILGIDEVGRGPWAGPLVVGAVVLGDADIEGLTDSKKLSKKRREVLDKEIRDKAASFGLGWVHADEIDKVGLSEALRVATIRAVEQIEAPYHEIIIDGTINFLKETNKGQFVTTLPKADLLVSSVSAASIIAKVARDTYMAQQDEIHQGYGFTSHVGYGTAAHRLAIDALGVTPLHRLSFAPLKKYRPVTTTKSIGDEAEDLVAAHLVALGHQIVERNWKTKFCEVDIVSLLGETIFFSEVKYRKNDTSGDGLEAVTATKLKQMRFAAELYVTKYQEYANFNQVLLAASVSGQPMKVDALIELE